VASLERDILVVLYYHGASEIWPDKQGSLWWEGLYKRGTTVYVLMFLTETNEQFEINMADISLYVSSLSLGFFK